MCFKCTRVLGPPLRRPVETVLRRCVRSVSGWESEQMQFNLLNEPCWAGASVTSGAEPIRSITR